LSYTRTLFYFLILAHLVADYLLQPSRLASAKAKSFSAMLLHGAIVLAAGIFFSYYFLTAWLVVGLIVVSAFHVILDRWRARRPAAKPSESLALSAFDQILHFVSLGALAYAYPSEIVDKLGLERLDGMDPYLINLILLTISAYIFLLTGLRRFLSGLLDLISLEFVTADELKGLHSRSARFVSSVEGVASFTLVLSGQEVLALILAGAILALRLATKGGRAHFQYHVFEVVLHVGTGALLGFVVLMVA